MPLPDLSAPVVALLTLGATAFGALLSRRHDRQQQARSVLLVPAELFADAASNALARLRYVTPPKIKSPEHRNERLLIDAVTREQRLEECSAAIDRVRSARAHVRVIFLPKSRAAEHSRETLQQLRACLESAERFYREYDREGAHAGTAWRAGPGAALRKAHKAHRWSASEALDDFYVDAARRLARPTWNHRLVRSSKTPRLWAADAPPASEDGHIMSRVVVRARTPAEAIVKMRSAGFRDVRRRAVRPSPDDGIEILRGSEMTSGRAAAVLVRDGDGDRYSRLLWLADTPDIDRQDDARDRGIAVGRR